MLIRVSDKTLQVIDNSASSHQHQVKGPYLQSSCLRVRACPQPPTPRRADTHFSMHNCMRKLLRMGESPDDLACVRHTMVDVDFRHNKHSHAITSYCLRKCDAAGKIALDNQRWLSWTNVNDPLWVDYWNHSEHLMHSTLQHIQNSTSMDMCTSDHKSKPSGKHSMAP